jgi:hypothetical protein
MPRRRHGVGGIDCISVIALSVILAAALQAQAPSSAVADIESAELARRKLAFEIINSRGEFASRRGALLMRLLVREDSAVAATLGSGADGIGEGWEEYHAALVDACLASCDKQAFLDYQLSRARRGQRADAAAIELLAIVRTKGFSRAQVESIDSAVIAAIASRQDVKMRHAGVAGIRRALTDSSRITAAMRVRLLEALRAATFDTLPTIRESAVRALAEAAEAADLPRLLHLAANDTLRSTRRGEPYYPIREAAAAGVRKIRGRGGPPIVFHPAGDSLAESAAAYDALWRAEGARMARALERASGLAFEPDDRPLRAVVDARAAPRGWFDRSYLPPRTSRDERRAALLHELGRQLQGRLFFFDEDDHPALHLWLHQAAADAYGRDFARAQEAAERERAPGGWDGGATRSDRLRDWAQLRDARLRDQLQPPPSCPASAVDTSGWRRAMGVAVGVELLHPPHYIRKIWERVSDTTSRYLEVHRNGRVTDAKVVISSSDDYPVRMRTQNPFRDRRCTIDTRSGAMNAWFGRRPQVRCRGCREPEPDYTVEMFLTHRRTGRAIHLHGNAPDSVTFREVMAIVATVRLLDLP